MALGLFYSMSLCPNFVWSPSSAIISGEAIKLTAASLLQVNCDVIISASCELGMLHADPSYINALNGNIFGRKKALCISIYIACFSVLFVQLSLDTNHILHGIEQMVVNLMLPMVYRAYNFLAHTFHHFPHCFGRFWYTRKVIVRDALTVVEIW